MFKGSIISQVIGILSSIVLAKIYGSEAYGLFGVYFSISGIFSLINTLQLENIIVITNNKKESINLMNSLFLISILLTSIIFAVSLVLMELFHSNYFSFEIVSISIIASIFFSINRINESFFTFIRKFKVISNAKIILSLLNLTFQFILFYKYKNLGLIYGSIISLLSISIYYFFKNKNYSIKINFKQLKNTISSHISIIKYIFPSNLINSLAINLIPFLILTFFSAKESGVYFLSLKILSIPLFLISTSVSNVYYEKSVKILKFSKEKLFQFTKKIVVINLLTMLLFLILINSIGIYFLELIFNKDWENLRLVTFILSFLMLARSSFNPISNIIIVLNKNHIALIFNIYLLIANFSAVAVGYFSNNIIQSIILFSILGSLGYIYLLFYFLKELKKIKTNHENTISIR